MSDIIEPVDPPPVDPTENEAELRARFILEAEESAARLAEARAALDAANAAALAASVSADG
jgi:hypothetical protein